MLGIPRSAVISAVALLAACAVWVQKPLAAVPGDANGDGRVSIADAVLVLRAAVNMITLSDDGRKAVDLDGDGAVTVKDALAVLRKAVGLPPTSDSVEPGGVPAPPPVTELPPKMVVRTEKFGHKPGEPVTINFTLHNPSSQSYTWTFPSSQMYEIRIVSSDGREVWHWSRGKGFLTVITTLTLGPGESKSWSEVWDQKDDEGVQVPDGYYRAVVDLVPMLEGGPAVSGWISFGIGLDFQEAPANYLPLIVGEERKFVCVDRGWPERIIKTTGYKTVDGAVYVAVSETPDGTRDVLLRMLDNGYVVQRVDNRDAVRYRLYASVGETWVFDADTPIKVTLASRSDVLETPLKKYEGCLRFEFFGGADRAWAEWLAPDAGWVGWNFSGIAGLVSYRIASYSRPIVVPPTPVPPGVPEIRVEIDPPYATVAPGANVQFRAKVTDSSGNILDVPVKWTCDAQIGAIRPDGTLTASQTPGAAGAVAATVVVEGHEYTGYAKVIVEAGSPPSPVPPDQYEYGRAYVQNGSVEAFLSGPGSVTFVLRVFAPSSSWELDRVDTATRDLIIVLTPVIRRALEPPIDLPVLKPLDAKVAVDGLAPGTYEVIVVGKDGELKANVTVPTPPKSFIGPPVKEGTAS